jgi:hypothetical protein
MFFMDFFTAIAKYFGKGVRAGYRRPGSGKIPLKAEASLWRSETHCVQQGAGNAVMPGRMTVSRKS